MGGLITRDQLLTNKNGDPWFDPNKIHLIAQEQVVWCDETHIEQEGGVILKTGVYIRFPMDQNRKYASNHPNPIYIEKVDKPTFEYTTQYRIFISIVAVMLENGEVKG